MGLDMYLYKKRFLNDDERASVENTFGIKNPRLIVALAAYWRKSYEVHEWFVNNCENEVENCGEAYISKEKLLSLLESCKKILAAKGTKKERKVAEKLLPDPDGTYGAWYWEDIEETVKQLSEIKDDNSDDDYYYHPWW